MTNIILYFIHHIRRPFSTGFYKWRASGNNCLDVYAGVQNSGRGHLLLVLVCYFRPGRWVVGTSNRRCGRLANDTDNSNRRTVALETRQNLHFPRGFLKRYGEWNIKLSTAYMQIERRDRLYQGFNLHGNLIDNENQIFSPYCNHKAEMAE